MAQSLLKQHVSWRLFPLKPGSKRPVKGLRWKQISSRDPGQIEAWAQQHPGCNWAVDCGASGLLVVDADTVERRPVGKDTLVLLELENDRLPLTLTVATPRGGEHRYFCGEGPTTQQRLGRHLDTRGRGGYVVAPGCVVGGKRYEILDGVLKVSPLPAWLSDLLGGVQIDREVRQRVPVQVERIDLVTAQRRAEIYLRQEAKPAIEGQGGDRQTYEVGCRLRDLGLPEPRAVELMLQHYNDRCVPPWSAEDLATKVRNAYHYAQSKPGVAAPEAVFSALTAAGKPEVEFADDPWARKTEKAAELQQLVGGMRTADQIDISLLPPRRWILGHRLVGGQVTVTVSPGGIGKSVYTTLEAMAVVTGQPLTGDTVHEQGPVLLVNTEDPVEEIERRLMAGCMHHRIPHTELEDLHYLSSANQPLRLVTPGRYHGEITIREDKVAWLIEYIRQHGILVAIFDPFVRTHMVDENDNMAIDAVVQCFGRIARETKAAVGLVHHTRKKGDSGGRGDAETARGASSLISACRIAHTLDTMDEKEAKLFKVPENERRWYLRLDDAKSNLAPPADHCRWFRRESVTLVNGDRVGTLRQVTGNELVVRSEDDEVMTTALLACYQQNAKIIFGSSLYELAKHLLSHYGAPSREASPATARRVLLKILERGVLLPDGKWLRTGQRGSASRSCSVVTLIEQKD